MGRQMEPFGRIRWSRRGLKLAAVPADTAHLDVDVSIRIRMCTE